MKIAIDARSLEDEKISGVGEYTLEIIKNLLEADDKNEYVIFSNSWKHTGDNFQFIEKYRNAKLKRFRYPNKLLNFFIWYFGWPKIDKLLGGADVLFVPNINFLAVSKNCKLVTTFHDLSFEHFPEFFTLKTRLWHRYFVNPRRIAKRSAFIIAVSQSTKKDLQNLYGIDPKKIFVANHGVSDSFRVAELNDQNMIAVKKKYSLPEKFILYLGNLDPRKNISALIGAWGQLQQNSLVPEEYKLVLVGNMSPNQASIYEENNVQLLGYIDSADKPAVYNHASLFVYPSHFEGFGLPLLEAMASGAPVVTSNSSSMPEVTGDAAVYANPQRPDELVKAIETVLKDDDLRNRMRNRGLSQIKKFGWNKCAQFTLEIIRTAASNRT